MNTTMIRTYEELITFKTFEERYEYLKLDGVVGKETFGHDRYLNQLFYKDPEWIKIRNYVIIRDGACDLAMPDREIDKRVLVHHMNVISQKDIINRSDLLLNPRFLITTSKKTHDSIHYGSELHDDFNLVIRYHNDMIPWKK